MTVNPGTGAGVDGSADSPPLSQDTIARLARAYMATYRGPHGDAPGADSAVTGPVDRTAARMMSPALVDAHCRLGRHRSIGDTRVAVYADDDPSRWFWFEGNFAAYEENKVQRLGAEAARPHRVTHRRLTRD